MRRQNAKDQRVGSWGGCTVERFASRIAWPWRASLPAILIAAIVTAPLATTGQTRHLHLVSTAWPPFTDAPGEMRIALELVEEALGRIGIVSESIIVDEERLTPSLLGEEFDGSAALWKSGEREQVLLYSESYLENRLILVGRRGSDVSASTLLELEGKRIALVAGYAYGDVVGTAQGPIVVESDSEEDSINKVLEGDADYTLMDEWVVEHLLRHHAREVRERLALGSKPILRRSLHLAVRRSLDDAESVVSRFNAELSGMVVDGTYHRILRLEWLRADIDGDGKREYVPRGGAMGATPPQRAYALFARSSPRIEPPEETKRRYYFRGTVYESWADVPDLHKSSDSDNSLKGLRLFNFGF